MKSKCAPVSPATSIKKESKEETCKLENTVNCEAYEWSDTNNELTLLGSIKAVNVGSKVKKKKQLHTEELLEKKLAAQQEEQVLINIVSGFK